MPNAADDVFSLADAEPEHALFALRDLGGRRTVTAKEFANEVVAVAKGLVTAGIRAGDRIAVMSASRYEWVLADFAIWTIGAVGVPLYVTDSAERVAWILADSGAMAAIAEDARCSALVEPVGGPIWSIEDGGLDALVAQGASMAAESVERRRAAGLDSPATIVYTSGTTGRPKGCLITHRNLVEAVDSIVAAEGVSESVLTPESSVLLSLPLADILARVVQLAIVRNGALTAHAGDADLVSELREFRPTVAVTEPRALETLYHTLAREAVTAGRGRLFGAAARAAVKHSERGGTALAHRVFDRLVYRRLRAAFGGRVTHLICGGEPLSARLTHFLRGVGVPVLEAYGLTETTGPVTLHLPRAQRIGTVGRTLPGWTIRIARDGEVRVKGPGVMRGYWRDDRSTRAAFDEDDWLRTGDLGEIHDGYLSITGRRKELIVTAGGENVAPSAFEDRLRTHPLIDNCVVVGDRRPFVGALITLDPDGFADWKRLRHKPPGASVTDLRTDSDLATTLQGVIDDVNHAAARTVSGTRSDAVAIKRFRVVPGRFTVNDELTPTQKIRREHVLVKYAEDVDELYRSPQR
ncbi:MAG TPA: AMP-dependent synthetase/ligase [Amycolatopsis sp.]|uniref:AMP-dependent synthetase/ligase n=1 Tax=Amycolatopsis sp. TaxID=37632 RepID=UPI002B471249|nr:AMP-dependent synthetase/ligase [Amycolatopsis sp.]HKS44889.1 AMP-dependent synthetase/ligase [Amycolatopsis sp.]